MLFHYNYATIVNVQAFLRGSSIELDTLKGVPAACRNKGLLSADACSVIFHYHGDAVQSRIRLIIIDGYNHLLGRTSPYAIDKATTVRIVLVVPITIIRKEENLFYRIALRNIEGQRTTIHTQLNGLQVVV